MYNGGNKGKQGGEARFIKLVGRGSKRQVEDFDLQIASTISERLGS